MPYIGASMKRLEDPRLLSGRGCYVADVQLAGMLHAAVVRSSHAHAAIRRVDARAALALPGVEAVLAYGDIAAHARPIPMRLSPLPELEGGLQYPLASDRVRYVGEPIAVVVAQTHYLAEDARELVQVDYEPLPAVTSVVDALRPGAVVLHEPFGSNLAASFSVENGPVGDSFARAALVVEDQFRIQRHTGVPLETRGLVAAYDLRGGRLTVWGPTKVPHFNRRVLSDLLGLPEHRIHFREPDVGGGFGVRGEFYPEDFLIPFLAIRLNCPVQWLEDRLEHLVATNHSREQEHKAALALDENGRILGLRVRFANDMGGYIRTHGATVPTMTAAMLPGPYRVPAYACEVQCVFTNKTPSGTYRGPGRFEAAFVRERLIDLAAEALDLEPAELRLRNLILPDEMPYDVGARALGMDIVYDSGDYPRLMHEALAAADAPGFRLRQRQAWQDGRYLGMGIGFFVEKAGLGPWEMARVELDATGGVLVFTGSASVGQGIETILAQIVADQLLVAPDRIQVIHGDTDRIPYGGGAFASRGTVLAGSAAYQAAQNLKQKVLRLAAHHLEAAPNDVELVVGGVQVCGAPDRALSIVEVASLAQPGPALAAGEEPGLSETAFFSVDHMTYPYGLHLAEVEVDVETGRVNIERYLVAYDVGRAVNPILVEGQLVGGLAQGIGGALYEQLVYDAEGQFISATFMDYLLPSVLEVPAPTVLLRENAPSPLNPLGVKGAGEGGAVGASAALANAVVDALRPLGVRVNELPLTPDQVLRLIQAKRLQAEDPADPSVPPTGQAAALEP
jgi:carbon-monoxide dehydrogenase large subunit